MYKVCCTCKNNIIIKDNFYLNKNTSDGFAAQCKMCYKKYREEHKQHSYPSQNSTHRKEYILNNINSINKARRELYRNNKEKFKIQNRKNYLKNIVTRSIYNKNYYTNNKEMFRLKSLKFRILNRQSILLKNRARQKKISCKIKQYQINNLLLQHDNKCFYCKISIIKGINLHLDHKIPISRNGEHTIDNLVPSCATCNLQKGTKTDKEFKVINVF